MPEKFEPPKSPLHDHKRFKKELIPPFNQLPAPMHQVFWSRDLLPEFLWIDSLFQEFGEAAGVSMFNDFLSAIDTLVPDGPDVADGTISSFDFVPEHLRSGLVAAQKGKIESAVRRPFGVILQCYPGCPMSWLVPDLDSAGTPDETRKALIRLFQGKDEYAARIRALPLVRYFIHGKIHLPAAMTDLITALKEYPHGDRDHVESFARSTHNIILQQRFKLNPRSQEWSKYFWRRNRELAQCRLGAITNS